MAADEIESHTLEVEGPRASSDRPLELSTESSFFFYLLSISLSLISLEHERDPMKGKKKMKEKRKKEKVERTTRGRCSRPSYRTGIRSIKEKL